MSVNIQCQECGAEITAKNELFQKLMDEGRITKCLDCCRPGEQEVIPKKVPGMLYDGWVYVARAETGQYKVGRSNNPFGRVKFFDTIMPVKVELVTAFPCDDSKAAEKLIHGNLKRWDRHVTGEWFDIPPESLAALGEVLCFVDGSFIYRLDTLREDGQFVNSCCLEYESEKARQWYKDGNLT